MPLNEIRNLYIAELRELLGSEEQIMEMLPVLARAAHSDELRLDFEQQLELSEEHMRRLQRIFEAMKVGRGSEICEVMAMLMDEASEVLKSSDASSVRDAKLVVVGQRLDQYQIAAYTAALAQAECLGENRALALLQQTLIEETEAERTLSWLGEKLRISREWVTCAIDEHNVGSSHDGLSP